MFRSESSPMPQPVKTPATIGEWLVQKFPKASKQTLKQMVQQRRVWVGGNAVDRLSAAIGPKDRVEVREKAKPVPRTSPLGGWIVYEDANLIVLNKPHRLLTSTNPRETRPTLLQMVKEHVALRDKRAIVGLIHRLDRDASGLLVFSKNDKAYQSLKRQFFHHSVERCYQAIVCARPQSLDGRRISRVIERADGSVHSTKSPGKGELAVTDYRTIRLKAPRALVEVHLQTGRKHQIRVHLSEMGCPILGDKMYNAAGPAAARLMLHATKLGLNHPVTGKPLVFESPLPSEMQAIAAGLPARSKIPTWSEVAAEAPQIRRKAMPPRPESGR